MQLCWNLVLKFLKISSTCSREYQNSKGGSYISFQIAFAFMLSAFVSKSSSSTVIGFCVFIIGFLTQESLCCWNILK